MDIVFTRIIAPINSGDPTIELQFMSDGSVRWIQK